ncbi:MAG TPA: hypothetical protein VEI07_01290 [Planctomycetaceae bacterium]|nr:hypothetical protein [Planctomycetaceae bacterium]
MKLISATLPLAGTLAMFVTLVGCTQESNPGGPGASAVNKTKETSRTDSKGNTTEEVVTTNKPVVTDKANTFTLHAPMMATTLDTGKKRDVDLSIRRGSDFKQSVKLEFKAPAGVTVTPAMATIPAGQDKITVTLEASKDAAAGKGRVEVTAVPESGQSVSLEIPVEVRQST